MDIDTFIVSDFGHCSGGGGTPLNGLYRYVRPKARAYEGGPGVPVTPPL